MSEFIIPNGLDDQIIFRSGDENFIEIESTSEVWNSYYGLSLEQAKELVLFLNEKIKVAEREMLYDIFDKSDVCIPRKWNNKPRTYEEATKMVEKLNYNAEYAPYKMVAIT